MSHTARPAPTWTPWRTITAFGFVSLAGDIVYEGMRSVSGPLLAGLGASALVVGLVTGAGEAMALALRLAIGPWADRTGRHWDFAIVGYAMTAVCVPLLAVTPLVGAAGLALASALIILERTGKAVRSPSKSTLLAHAAGAVGRGKGFGVHKVLDQFGAVTGPLVVAGMAALTSALWPGLALLAIPGAVAVVLLLWTRRHVPDPSVYDADVAPAAVADVTEAGHLSSAFWLFAVACGLATAGLMTYGVISYHFIAADLVEDAWVPVIYAGAMLVVAAGALATGIAYDRWNARVLHALPLLVAATVALVFRDSLGLVLLGILAWAAATGVQDSTVKALVADLVPKGRLATAYGVFAAVQGVAALAGAGVAGGLYAHHRDALVIGLVTAQLLSAVLLVRVLRRAG
jgi:hypothetical protein